MNVLTRGTVLIGFLGAALGCADGSSATGPTEDHPAIPQFTAAACAEWSCSWGDCQQDPAHYGACCIEAASAEYPATSAPSCEGPRNGAYCQSFPARCQDGEDTTNQNPPGYCYHADANDICIEQNGCFTDPNAPSTCVYDCNSSTFSDYPECFGDGNSGS